ncbi:MAG: nuclear transport factor 2 family protein, partial [Bacteroidia bacterium]
MHPNAQLLTDFYTAFQRKDFAFMQQCYSDQATFNDPVFKNLNAAEVRAMWEMLISRGKDLVLEFKDIKADDKIGEAKWIATYSFSKTGRKVVNHIQAQFVFENGKIVQHKDDFNFYAWSKQALGISGLLL